MEKTGRKVCIIACSIMHIAFLMRITLIATMLVNTLSNELKRSHIKKDTVTLETRNILEKMILELRENSKSCISEINLCFFNKCVDYKNEKRILKYRFCKKEHEMKSLKQVVPYCTLILIFIIACGFALQFDDSTSTETSLTHASFYGMKVFSETTDQTEDLNSTESKFWGIPNL